MIKNLSKRLKAMAILGVVVCGVGSTGMQSNVFADSTQLRGIEFSVDENGHTEVVTNNRSIDNDEALRAIKDYHITANVSKKKSANTSQSPKYWANGWVTISRKDTGKNVYHSTTARLISTSDNVTTLSDSGRKWGTGRVDASSTNNRTPNNNTRAKIYYSIPGEK